MQILRITKALSNITQIQNKSYRADIKVVAPEDPQTQQYVSDYDGRQDDPPQLMHEQSTISPEIWHVPGEIPPNISLIPSEKFNEFDVGNDENFTSSGCGLPYKACYGSQQHDVNKTLTFHADENDFYNC
ncbi:hypothetical protein HELRODRAFT_179450 [Helobdella robusta]|uniref:Uncharacterized protein n=1 Tax=Helobdella robusta TaxID=6412 RepID=T1FEQ6_HELRO|nr:hypothetical protein HELRODRAFT_179450 [Helobdella robusta]ESN95381.1 hypothetical protein HELRODRAFT_179450 [Helobdella robusta]